MRPNSHNENPTPGKSSRGSLLARRSNSACFRQSSWIITTKSMGDTLCLGFADFGYTFSLFPPHFRQKMLQTASLMLMPAYSVSSESWNAWLVQNKNVCSAVRCRPSRGSGSDANHEPLCCMLQPRPKIAPVSGGNSCVAFSRERRNAGLFVG